MAPIVAVLLAAAVLMYMGHRQEQANERNEREAVRRAATLARSYAGDMLNELRDRYPSEARTRDIAQRHDGRLVSSTRSGESLTTVVEFFAAYEEASMFGTSYSRTYRCYSVVLQEDAKGVPQARTTLLEKCDVA
ncbi:hypothetical protein [Streptomyces spongiae]|uniref:Type II secretion system protein n=1 Tax=Streptomyces spongiae TaxID=565072 RepID=A0A5N8XHR2_9ACTN|nr:hypothetical protein [Streptomyces spongiae]MPY58992.1 hypothetical protein [Streptomyces spongiae]